MPGSRRLRLLLLVLLASLVSQAERAEAAWKVVFRDDGRAQWQELFTSVGAACSTVARAGAGLRVRSCPVATTGNGMTMLWVRQPVSGKIKVEFDFVHAAAEAKRAGTASALMLLARGDGSGGFPVDPTRWGAQCCASSTVYGPHTRGLQHNFAYRHDPRGNATMRLRGLRGTDASYGLLAESPPHYPFETGRSYHVTATRIGSRLTVAVEDRVTGLTSSFTTTNAYIGSLGRGWIGLRQMHGRDERIAGFKISVDG